MATKKQNKRATVRATRRALNTAVDFFKQIGGRRLMRHKYGAGLTRIRQDKED